MTVWFKCDREGCSAEAIQGTITGGLAVGWTLEYIEKTATEGSGAKATTKTLTHTKHYCGACKEKRAAEREERRAAEKGKRS